MTNEQRPRARAVSARPDQPVRRDLLVAAAVLAAIGLADAASRLLHLF